MKERAKTTKAREKPSVAPVKRVEMELPDGRYLLVYSRPEKNGA